MAAEAHGVDLIPTVALLAAGVIAVPIFKRIGLGSVFGYLVAGIAIGPFGFGLFRDPTSILSVAELGVVMLLFIIGLELKPSRLWSLRREIFGLGLSQVLVCVAVIAGIAIAVGIPPPIALVAAIGLSLSSTAIVMQILEERGETSEPHGQKIFSVLLLQDLTIVPALAVVAFLAPGGTDTSGSDRLVQIGIAAGAVALVVLAGKFLLNPLFRILAQTHAREVMTADLRPFSPPV